jgi:hypothetical protein
VKTALVGLLCLIALSSAFGSVKGKKLIEYGWDVPDTRYVRDHVREMEKMPFDGVVIHVGQSGQEGPLPASWRCWGKKRFEPKDYEPAIDDLRATKFERLTDNFIQTETGPGEVDWFDPEWSAVAYNFACLARVAKQGGCKGIMLDTELYVTYPVWSYVDLPKELKAAHTAREYQDKARERGREWIRAVNKEFPDITILCLFGYSLPYCQTNVWARRPLEDTPAALMASFFDGIVDAASPGTTLVDGFEFSYGYRDRSEFLSGRNQMLHEATINSRSKKGFAKHVRAGFGLWLDLGHGDKFQVDDPSNYFTPPGFRASVNYALDTCDKYVWIYSEKARWWGDAPPTPFVEALRLARQGPGPGEPRPIVTTIKAEILHQHPDSWCFAEMRKTMTELYDLPKDGWKFRFDENRIGYGNKWYTESLDDSSWLTISIGKFWEEQLSEYDGTAWYRTRFTAPEVEARKRVYLGFGGVADNARVWLNGKFVGEHGTEWKDPFALDCTRQLRPGAENVLAVEVTDWGGTGGLWTSIKLMKK